MTQNSINEDGTFTHSPGKSFEDGLNEVIVQAKSGNYQNTRPRMRTSVPNMKIYRNPFNDRAREGFQYWPKTRPKPTLYGKYGMGSYKSVLGLGDAVRT